MLQGGAPTSPAVLEFMHKCWGHCTIIDSYGTMETGTIAVNGKIHPKASI